MIPKHVEDQRQWWLDRLPLIVELRERELTIVRERFGIPHGEIVTLDAVAKAHEVTTERIRQILESARKRVARHELRNSGPITHSHPLGRLDLNKLTLNKLRREGIDVVGELCSNSGADLESIPSFGTGCLADVRAKLKRHNLWLQDD